VDGKRTEDWYLSRLELVTGIGLVLLIGFLGWLATRPMMGDTDMISLGPLLLRSRVFTAIVALVGAVSGLLLMIRILRGPRDQPPRWRYRDR
jgi:hypothetical protein